MRAVFAYTGELDEWLREQSPELPASEAKDEIPPRPAPAEAAPGPSSRARFPARLAVLGVLALLALAAVATFVVPRRGPPPFDTLAARPITADPGSERDPDISPDGRFLAYASVAPDLATRIQIRLVDGGDPRPLTSASVNEWSPVWSPDGTRLAFLRGDPAGDATVFTISALGGEERRIADVRPYPRRRTNLIGHLLDWAPDGQHVIVPDRTDDASRLLLIDTATGAREAITAPGPAEFDVEPSISSDGRLLLFNRVRGEFQSDVFVQALGSGYKPDGPPRKLPSGSEWNGTPRLLEWRDEVLTSAGSLPRLSLWHQPLDGSRPPESLGIIGDYATQSAVHQASGRIVSRTYRAQTDMLRFAMPTSSTAAPLDPPVYPFLESTFIDRNPIYSPDGSRIAFISDRTGHRQLWVASGTGEDATEWRQTFEVDLPPPAWSPDGSKVAFTGAGPSGWSQLYLADAATRVATPITRDALEYSHAVWSPDGRFLYAAAADKSVYGIYRVPAGGGAAELVLPGYRGVRGADPAARGLYVTRSDERNRSNLYFAPLPGAPAVHLAEMNFSEDAWVTPDGVYYMARLADRPLAPVALSFRTHAGIVRLLQEYTRPPGRGLSVSPDGRFAVTTRVVPPISDLLLLEPAR